MATKRNSANDFAITPAMVGSEVRKSSRRKTNPALSHDEVVQGARRFANFTGEAATPAGYVQFPKAPKVAVVIGSIDGILYSTVRDGVPEKYKHEFKAGDRPSFVVSADGKQIWLIGGRYRFTARGIVDNSDRKRRK